MFFIILLSLVALAIACSAAYFSVYGLATTFHGIFWSVVFMGASLEAGKLIAASYLSRYWKHTNAALKTGLIAGIIALMLITSMGIFGYLSVGYMSDAAPLKQIEQEAKLLDDEKTRLLARKIQIDDQIAKLPTNSAKSRLSLMKGFKQEQEQVTARINELDKNILKIKTDIIQTESHVGVIVYLAKAIGANTDDATKYLIYLIIFVFDPMAVALTLALNNAIRVRREEGEPRQELVPGDVAPVLSVADPTPRRYSVSYSTNIPQPSPAPVPPVEPEEPLEQDIKPDPVEHPLVEQPTKRVRPYAGVTSGNSIEELLNQRHYFMTKEAQGEILTQDERWARDAVNNALHRSGYNVYI